MFYAIWGVKYGSAVPEAMELIQLRRDAEDEIVMDDFKIMLTARFFQANSEGDNICFVDGDSFEKIPMMRQEGGKGLSLADFVVPEESGRRSPFGMFAISVSKKSKAHVHGCSCPACSNYYDDMIGRTVRMTLAEAASKWLDEKILEAVRKKEVKDENAGSGTGQDCKVIKPAAGYASCPDHTLKGDILQILGILDVEHTHGQECTCGCEHRHDENKTSGIDIRLTESYAMTPESSICGMVFMHQEACYPDIRKISRKTYEDYARRRGMDATIAQRFLGHLLK
jgi:5-methyltetrahydrofolate--homocysteine methyltransferase